MENIRTESFLGNDKVIVGNKFTDLVLETLGKVYIKSGNSSKLLDDLLKTVDEAEVTEENIIILDNTKQLEDLEYPGDGKFIFVKLTSILYISCDGAYIPLAEGNIITNNKYVKKSGDTMTGPLEINTSEAPFIVASSLLVKNLNSQYVNGCSSDDFAKKIVNEYITGNWTFAGKNTATNKWVFKDTVNVQQDLILNKNLTSPEFASGFGGYGWRLDATTNTLTIDNLVVRKAMQVYEMVINTIQATNGSLWVSNSSKCSQAQAPILISQEDLQSIGDLSDINNRAELVSLFPKNNYFLLYDNPDNYDITEQFTTQLANSDGLYTAASFVEYKYLIYITDINNILDNPLFTGIESLYNTEVLDTSWEDYNSNHPGSCTYEEFNKFSETVKLIYLYKTRQITQWSDSNAPIKWDRIDTFNRKQSFYIVPKIRQEHFISDGVKTEKEYNIYCVYPYYKYFGLKKPDVGMPTITNIWVIKCKDNSYPYFRFGDIIRCQKYTGNNIKYYDAVVLNQIDSYSYVIQIAESVFDNYSDIQYTNDGNIKSITDKFNDIQYNRTQVSYNVNTNTYTDGISDDNSVLAVPQEGDDLIQMGNIFNVERQNAVYITSTDSTGPYIDILSGLNRPDYSVLYNTPKWAVQKALIKNINGIYQKGYASNYFRQTSNPGSVNPDISSTISKNTPLIFYQTKDVTQVLINDGEVQEISQEILDNPSEYGYFLTEIPTLNSEITVIDSKYQLNYTKITKVRLGNLSGIYNETFKEKQPYGYGLYGENVFLTGEFYLNNGQSVAEFSPDGIILRYKNAGLELVSEGDGEVIKLSANKIYVGDGENNAMFTVKDGKTSLNINLIDVDAIFTGEINAENAIIKGATIDNATIQQGTIGGFKINDGYLGLSNGEIGQNFEGLSLYDNFIGFYDDIVELQENPAGGKPIEIHHQQIARIGIVNLMGQQNLCLLNSYSDPNSGDNCLYIFQTEDTSTNQFLDRNLAIYSTGGHKIIQRANDYYNVPGVLWAAEVNGGNVTVLNSWGDGLGKSAKLSIKKLGTGTYQVIHNLGNGQWMPFVQCFSSAKWPVATITVRDENSFTFTTHENGGDGLMDSDFFVMIVGRNKE